jgi:hypothetical protein
MISDEDDFYMKNVALDEIYNFLVLKFFNLRSLKCLKKLNKFSAVY